MSTVSTASESKLHRLTYTGASETGDKDHTFVSADIILSTTLSALGAPLAFKVLHEQSRLTCERLRRPGYSPSVALATPESAVWGTCVLWTLLPQTQSLSFQTTNHATDVPHGTEQWLQVRVIHKGLEVTRSLHGTSCVKHVIRTPYWAVVLTALCCGALEHWSHQLALVSLSLRLDPQQSLREQNHNDELCQRCGNAYKIPPSHSLCHRFRDITGTHRSRVQAHSESPRYCLNHKRVYSASFEEKWEFERSRLDCLQPCAGVRTERRPEVEPAEEELLSNFPTCDQNRAKLIATWWNNGSKFYWGQGSGQTSGLSRREFPIEWKLSTSKPARQVQLAIRGGGGLEDDPGWWSWQKDCRRIAYPGRPWCNWESKTMSRHRDIRAKFLDIISKLFPSEQEEDLLTCSIAPGSSSASQHLPSRSSSSLDATLEVVQALERHFTELAEWFTRFEETKARNVIGSSWLWNSADIMISSCGE
ncbi:hypothetical protein WMY93_011371 [Mugilogobius chulae]|uniref:Uncharacterized protein n=1 Tax=Mugilogobius chulae TaxID=88201 RepID=A0AAW0P2M0_9GOBI